MREEIEAAVHFVGRVIISSCTDPISSFSEFKSELSKVMEEKFKGHWHDDSPGKGQGYRSIRIHPTEPVDPLLNQAAMQSKFSVTYLRIPVELTVWVDPKDVSCRFGDLKSTYCTVLKDEENQANTLDVDELLENAKALYSRQQHFVIVDNPHVSDIPFVGSSNDLFGYGMQMNGVDGCYLFPTYGMYSPWYPDSMTDRSTPPPLPYGLPSLGINTTPRKNGKNHFRKGSNGTGRGSKHYHNHHHHHHNSGDFSNQNHINTTHNSNTNGNAPNGSISNGKSPVSNRFQLVKGTKNFHQVYSLPPQNHFGPMQQQKHHQQDHQQTSSKRRLNSESDKDAK